MYSLVCVDCLQVFSVDGTFGRTLVRCPACEGAVPSIHGVMLLSAHHTLKSSPLEELQRWIRADNEEHAASGIYVLGLRALSDPRLEGACIDCPDAGSRLVGDEPLTPFELALETEYQQRILEGLSKYLRHFASPRDLAWVGICRLVVRIMAACDVKWLKMMGQLFTSYSVEAQEILEDAIRLAEGSTARNWPAVSSTLSSSRPAAPDRVKSRVAPDLPQQTASNGPKLSRPDEDAALGEQNRWVVDLYNSRDVRCIDALMKFVHQGSARQRDTALQLLLRAVQSPAPNRSLCKAAATALLPQYVHSIGPHVSQVNAARERAEEVPAFLNTLLIIVRPILADMSPFLLEELAKERHISRQVTIGGASGGRSFKIPSTREGDFILSGQVASDFDPEQSPARFQPKDRNIGKQSWKSESYRPRPLVELQKLAREELQRRGRKS